MKDFYGKDADRLKGKKLFLFDMDGTIYLGENLFEGVPELLKKIEENGGRYVFITNNASKSVVDYVEKLHRLGLTQVTEEQFFTSAQATLMMLKEKHAEDLIYLQGTKSLVEEYKKSGLNITTDYADGVGAIVVAFDPELTGEVLRVIKELKDAGWTMLVVTHEMDFARHVADRVVFFADGLIEEEGTPDEVLGNPKSEKMKAFLSAGAEE